MTEQGYDQFIGAIRKPELRTEWSDFYVTALKKYGGEIYAQELQPSILEQFKAPFNPVINSGFLVLSGSIKTALKFVINACSKSVNGSVTNNLASGDIVDSIITLS